MKPGDLVKPDGLSGPLLIVLEVIPGRVNHAPSFIGLDRNGRRAGYGQKTYRVLSEGGGEKNEQD